MSDLGRRRLAFSLAVEKPVVPVAQEVYWVATTVFPPGDPEDQRPVVVLAASSAPGATIAVVARSCADDFGVGHAADAHLGLTGPGRFSRRHAVSGWLWTSAHVTPLGRLDDATFAAVVDRFGG